MIVTDIKLGIYDDEKARPFVNGILNSIARESSGKQIDEQ